MSNTDILPENQIVSSAIIDKYIGESARLIREMFGYARDHQVSLIVPFFLFAKLMVLNSISIWKTHVVANAYASAVTCLLNRFI
jgi:hypothetical protein